MYYVSVTIYMLNSHFYDNIILKSDPLVSLFKREIGYFVISFTRCVTVTQY